MCVRRSYGTRPRAHGDGVNLLPEGAAVRAPLPDGGNDAELIMPLRRTARYPAGLRAAVRRGMINSGGFRRCTRPGWATTPNGRCRGSRHADQQESAIGAAVT